MGIINLAIISSILLDGNCILFTSAFILLMIAFLGELLSFIVIGTGIFSFLDTFMPEIEPDTDFDDGVHLMSWAKHKNVPLSIWSALWLAIFAVVGMTIQITATQYMGHTINMFLASAIAIIPAFFGARYVSQGLGTSVFVDLTSAVEITSLVGSKAAITIGKATSDRPAECKVLDEHGKPHYLRCVPKNDSDVFGNTDILTIIDIVGNIAIVDKV